ncbi:thioredoxin domain-containing protein [Homoserinibacter sp. GY 40078]|uniref:DsbA family protein n=1 Tax=Homoserinibacter sp. GY 40078 TaxID=2603275 RepID=UPI0011CBBE7A|nr:thioredoxin domain-containing protein [Homoserinibacter sp. GY 40078]TXK19722.1 thioredoxin domain-containing protein [Homoserinibacter sp. GY 40078]
MTNSPRPTKNQRREEAREAARAQREKAQKRQKTLRWLIPTVASVAILAIVGGVIWAVVALQPAPKAVDGPANMISDGILFEADGDGGVTYVATPAVQAGEDPQPTEQREGVLNIVTLVDFSCPACKAFEETYSESIQSLVADGSATLEVHPVAILDRLFLGSEYSTRSNNVAACVAEYQPESFLDVMAAMYANQPDEQTTGLTNAEIVSVVEGAGVTNDDVTQCITDETFTPWVTTATSRSGVQGTPTVIVNGTTWDSSTMDFPAFLEAEQAKL